VVRRPAAAGMGLLDRYGAWVRANAAAVLAAEGALSSLTWLVPDRFSDSELALEALNSALGLLSMYHSQLLAEPAPGAGAGAKQPAALPWPLWLGALHQARARWRARRSQSSWPDPGGAYWCGGGQSTPSRLPLSLSTPIIINTKTRCTQACRLLWRAVAALRSRRLTALSAARRWRCWWRWAPTARSGAAA